MRYFNRPRFYILLFVVTTIVPLHFSFSAPSADLILFQDGSSRIFFDVNDSLRKQMNTGFASDPLADFERIFSTMTGKEMGPKEDGKIALRLELLQPKDVASPLKDLPEGIRETASEISVTPESVTIRAESSQGLSGGLYKILEDWGCRWILPGELGEVIPLRKSLTLPMGSAIAKLGSDTAFGAFRPESALWLQRNRLLPATWLPCYHYWKAAVSPEKYFQTHPEYYALVDGQRKSDQPESVNPEVIRLTVEYAKQFFRSHPAARSYPMDPEDNTFFSEAPEATKIDPPGTGQDGLPLMTDRVVQFANAVLSGFSDEFPDKTVGYYSYLNHAQPPVNVKPDPKTVVGVTRFGFCNLRLVPTPNTPSPQEFENLVKAWLALTPNVYIYEYNPPTWAASLPFPNYMEIAESMHRLHGMGVKGFYSDTPFGEHAPGVFLNAYIRRRMMVDPDQDPKALMKDYCQSFFGPAAEVMLKYYEILSEVTKFNNPTRPAIGVNIFRFEEIFPRAVVVRAAAQLDAALKEPGLTDVQRKRLEWVKLGQDYLSSYLAAVDAAKAGNYEATEQAFKQTFKFIALQERQGREFLKMDDARIRIEAARSTILATYFPARQGMITRWNLLGPIPRGLISPEKEKDILTGKILQPVAVDGHSFLWKPYLSKEGLLSFNVALGRSGLEVPLSKAFASATVTAPETTEARVYLSSFFPYMVYFNGEKIYERSGFDFDFPDKTAITISLKKGDNQFVILSDERVRSTKENTLSDGGDWTISVALRDAHGQPLNLPGIR